MRATRFLSWSFALGLLVFTCAFDFKYMKWPAGTALLIASAVLSLLGALMPLGRETEHRMLWAMRMAVAMVVVYAVWRLLYWPGAAVVAAAALALGALAVVRFWKSDGSRKLAFAGMLVVSCAGLVLMATPVHAVYHYMFFETPGAQRFMHSGVGHWYRYSWFLYQDGHYDRSVAMLDSAVAEIHAYDARTGKDGTWLIERLDAVRAQVVARDWKEFKEFHK